MGPSRPPRHALRAASVLAAFVLGCGDGGRSEPDAAVAADGGRSAGGAADAGVDIASDAGARSDACAREACDAAAPPDAAAMCDARADCAVATEPVCRASELCADDSEVEIDCADLAASSADLRACVADAADCDAVVACVSASLGGDCATTDAGCGSGTTTLVVEDGQADHRFGSSVSVSGTTAVVGAYGEDAFAGAVYVYERAGGTWSLRQRLVASDAEASDWFGFSVAVDGDTIVVGAYGDDVGANADQGSAYVFVRSGDSWSEQQKLVAADGAGEDFLGREVAIDGDTVALGAYLDDVGSSADQGSAYVFVRSGDTWSEQQKLTAADGLAGDNFGWEVAVSGDTLVAGAYLADIGAQQDRGSAYVFVRSAGSWSQQGKLLASDGAGGDRLGSAVSVSGDTAVVGASRDDVGDAADQGSVYVFVRSGEAWSEQRRLGADDGAAADRFGQSAAISGDRVLVGSYLSDVESVPNRGAAYLFVRGGAGWSQQRKLIVAGVEGDRLGYYVSLDGTTAIVGAHWTDVEGRIDQGAVHIFDL